MKNTLAIIRGISYNIGVKIEGSLKYRRILLKLSGEVLKNSSTGECIDAERLRFMAGQIKTVRTLGAEVGIVLGGGNIFRGLAGAEKGVNRVTGDSMGMLATIINALAMSAELEAQGVPDDLKYLMAIESNVNETAVSVAGAAGLWQFMRDVGREYGLEVATTVDERYNVRKETIAACAYLKKAYAKFGDWMTVAASYNGGIGGIDKKREVQLQPKALDLHLVDETSRYMFRILVAKMMFEDPASFGFELPRDEYYPYIPPRKTVVVSASVDDLAEFAMKQGVSYAQLRRANPWLRDVKLVAGRGKSYEIAIPDIEAERNYFLSLSQENH